MKPHESGTCLAIALDGGNVGYRAVVSRPAVRRRTPPAHTIGRIGPRIMAVYISAEMIARNPARAVGGRVVE